MALTTESAAGAAAIRSFTVEFSEGDVADLRAIAATRFPEREPIEDRTVHPLGDPAPSQGVELATIEALVRYWGSEYDLRRVEARLNALPQFLTEIDDLEIHFIHVKSRHENALPVILIHGWPGSVVEMLSVVGPLTDPTAHGGSAEDAFDVVVPSIPGYGFSGKPTRSGWGPERVASAAVELAAWIADHDAQSYLDITSAFVDGSPVGNLTRDEVLDNITLAWLTNTGISSARLYHENAYGFFDAKGVSVPAAVTVFPKELYQAPRSWAERAYPNLIYFNEVDRGGHFAAWQEPQLFSEELRAAFRSLG